jgi:hypothetical protein
MTQTDTLIRTQDEFVEKLNRSGIIAWMPIKGLALPNLAEMMGFAGSDVMLSTWFWKDDLHHEKKLFYGKLLAGNPVFVSMEFLPKLIAARGDVDPHTFHEQGRLTDEAIRIYNALNRFRSLATRDLRREAGLTATRDKTAFENGLNALSALFQICKVDITGRTRGTYSYVWGMVEDWIPEVLSEASKLRPLEAAGIVMERLEAIGVRPEPRQWKRYFGWDADTIANSR